MKALEWAFIGPYNGVSDQSDGPFKAHQTGQILLEHSPMAFQAIGLCRSTGRRPVDLANIGKSITPRRKKKVLRALTKLVRPSDCTVKTSSSPQVLTSGQRPLVIKTGRHLPLCNPSVKCIPSSQN